MYNCNDKKKMDIQHPNIIFLLSTESLPFDQRNEGEITLFRFINKILNKNSRYIIISNDSDISAMYILREDDRVMLVIPPYNGQSCIGLNNYNHIMVKLNINSQQLFSLTVLYFIFFGSDYNLGLISCWTISKHDILKNAILHEETNLVSIFNQMKRCRSTKNEAIIWQEWGDSVTYQDYLFLFKLIVYEAVHSARYYKSLGKSNPSLLNLYSNNHIKVLTKTIKLIK